MSFTIEKINRGHRSATKTCSRFEKILDEFHQSLTTKIGLIQNAYRQRDRDSMLQITHRLMGSSGLYGYDKLGFRARELHEAVRHQEPAEIGDYVSEVVAAASEAIRTE